MDQSRAGSVGHDRSIVLTSSQQHDGGTTPAHDQASQHSSMEEDGPKKPPPQLRSWGQPMAHREGETGCESTMVQWRVTPRNVQAAQTRLRGY